MQNNQNKTKKMVTVAMIGAIYTVLTLVISPFAYGAVQFRVSEMMTVLPAYTPLAIPGLTLGCCLSNIIGALTGMNPLGFIDAVIGSLATLIATVMSYYIGKSEKKWIRYVFVPLPPVIVNAIIVGLELTVLFNGKDAFFNGFIANSVSVLIGQLVICYTLGILLMVALDKNDIHKKIFKN